MNAWLTVDFVAKRYGCLPSQVLRSGDSIDIKIAAFAVAYENYLVKKEKNKADGKITPDLSVDEMKKMIDRVKNKNGQTNSK
jgi:hypothetical protein